MPKQRIIINRQFDQDSIQRFLFEQANVRGELVHLNNSYQTLLAKHDYPLLVRNILGEALTATVLLAANLKFAGSLIMQIEGEGPINLLVAECNNEYQIRGVARWDDEKLDTNDLAKLFANSRLIITINSVDRKQRYQGIVELHGNSISECIENYFNQSEQLPCKIWTAANEHGTAGLLLQTLPTHSDQKNYWEHLLALTNTVKNHELLTLPNASLLTRLYHQENVQLFDQHSISFYCRCSLEKMEKALRMLEYEEAMELAKEQKYITVTCEFCNHTYQFDQVDVGRVFKGTGLIDGQSLQ